MHKLARGNVSLYAEYLKERTYDEIIETEHGFATYRFIEDGKAVYIIDVYTVPEMRQKHVASELADQIAKIARNKGCTYMIGTVNPAAKGSTESLKALLGYGMRLQSSHSEGIILKKELLWAHLAV
jgi:GNAT superfamily N-acetyltransferase